MSAPHAWRELRRAVLRRNLAAAQAALSPGSQLIFVVKSDAYGHGMGAAAACAWEAGVRWFAVVGLDSALVLRRDLPAARILLLGPLWPGEPAEAAAVGIDASIVGPDQIARLAEECRRLREPLRCHAEIDTGMGRLGLAWDRAADALAPLAAAPGLRLEGAYTHFASADEPGSDFAEVQAGRFAEAWKSCRARGLSVPFRHMANSGGYGRARDWDVEAVRLGILLYGYGPSGAAARAATQPCLEWKTRVILTKDVPAGFPVGYGSTYATPAPTRIATLAAGYADGYPRRLGNAARVIIGDRLCPVVGRVSMNLITVDAGRSAPVREGDEAVLMGSRGGLSVWADELAALSGTIPYEILTGIRSPLMETADREGANR